MRKRLSLLALVASGLLACVARGNDAAASAPLGVVRVAHGSLSGLAGTNAKISVFRGIPFAAPPVGALRWRPPQPVKAWDGVRPANRFGASAIQADQRSLLPWTEEYMFGNETSEDCLYLNVWTPARRSDERLPVYVYIHGGAYTSGSGEVSIYDGEGLASKGVIVVTFNYRLGVLGFLAHPELTAESPERASGNYGLMDQIAALRWVKENISAFGGDPDRVTIGGQSAGAGSVHHLLVSPLAKGLFHRAIAQSGPWRRADRSPVLSDAEREGVRFGAAAGAESLSALRALPAERLLARQLASETRFRPIVDGWVVPEQIPQALKEGRQNDVPLLTGWTADEQSFSKTYGHSTVAEFTAQVNKDYGANAPAVLALYPLLSDNDAGQAQKAYARDATRVHLWWYTGLRAEKGKSKDWTYFFERAIPWPAHPEYQAFHSGELPYVFNNLRLLDRPWTDLDHRLADEISDYWVNFIHNADPNGARLPYWPDDNRQLMRFGSDTSPEPVLSPEKASVLLR